MHSTRGRANLLRAMVTGRFKSQEMAEKTVYRGFRSLSGLQRLQSRMSFFG